MLSSFPFSQSFLTDIFLSLNVSELTLVIVDSSSTLVWYTVRNGIVHLKTEDEIIKKPEEEIAAVPQQETRQQRRKKRKQAQYEEKTVRPNKKRDNTAPLKPSISEATSIPTTTSVSSATFPSVPVSSSTVTTSAVPAVESVQHADSSLLTDSLSAPRRVRRTRQTE